MNHPAVLEQMDYPDAVNADAVVDQEQAVALAKRRLDPDRRFTLVDGWHS